MSQRPLKGTCLCRVAPPAELILLAQAAVLAFQQRPYSFLTGNCHSFVAHAMNAALYDGSRRWNAVWLTLGMLRRGSHVGLLGFAKTWAPFACIMTLGLYFLGRLFFLSWLALFALSSGWFIAHSLLSHNSGDQAPAPSTLHTAYTI